MVKAYTTAGLRLGGTVLEGVRVDTVRAEAATVRIGTTAGDLAGRALVLATGAATPALLTSLGIPHALFVRMVQVQSLRTALHRGVQPAFLDEEYHVNGRPGGVPDEIYLGHPVSVNGFDEGVTGPGATTIDRAQQQRALTAAGRRFKWAADAQPSGGLRSAECFSPGDRGWVTWVNREGNVLALTGFNGGAFKFAPWAAAEAARLLNPHRDI